MCLLLLPCEPLGVNHCTNAYRGQEAVGDERLYAAENIMRSCATRYSEEVINMSISNIDSYGKQNSRLIAPQVSMSTITFEYAAARSASPGLPSLAGRA